MKIRLNKNISLMLLIAGVLDALYIVSIFINSGNFFFIDLLIAIILIIAGISSRNSVYFELGESSLIMRNMFGGVSKEYPFSSKLDFKIVGKNVIIAQEGKRGEKLYGFTANPTDWAAFQEWINQ